MALLLPRSVFVHVPRTGGQWFRSCIAEWANDLPESSTYVRQEIGYNHCDLSEINTDNKGFGFGFVRHPWSWVKSRWSHIKKKNQEDRVPSNNKLDQEFHESFKPTFWATVENITKNHKSLVTRTFESYLEDCDFIARQEDLPKSALVISRLCGERIKPKYFYSTQPKNKTTDLFSPETYHVNSSLKREFLSLESETVEKYYSPKLPPTFVWIN